MLIMPKLTQIKKVEALTPHDHNNNRRSAGGDASNVSGARELSAAARIHTQYRARETNAKDVTVFFHI